MRRALDNCSRETFKHVWTELRIAACNGSIHPNGLRLRKSRAIRTFRVAIMDSPTAIN